MAEVLKQRRMAALLHYDANLDGSSCDEQAGFTVSKA
jgi:hypothetical protein